MTDQNTDTRACLFHIGPPRVDAVIAMAARLAELPVRVRDCSNVYQGLARLCIANSDKPAAVVVSVDVMNPAELEFFRIVARLFPALMVYVYGGERSCARIDRAIELGARDRASDEVLIELGRSRISPATPTATAEAVEPPELVTVSPRDAQVNPLPDAIRQRLADRRIDPLESPLQEEDELLLEEDATEGERTEEEPSTEQTVEDEDAQVRVPWLTYKDAPARRAPESPSHVPPPAVAPMPKKKVTRAAEPLLSQEELRALLDGDGLPLPDTSDGSTKEASS